MRTSRLSILVSICLLAVSTLSAGDPWKEKPWTEWTEKDCIKILQKSPWGKRVLIDNQNDEFSRFYIVLYSALPIRQAIIRLMQIRTNFESMAPEDRKAFDATSEMMLSSVSQDSFIFLVTGARPIWEKRNPRSRQKSYERALISYWSNQNLSSVRNTSTLKIGEQITLPPSAYIYTRAGLPGLGWGFAVAFPRQLEGRPHVKSETKNLIFKIITPYFDAIDSMGVVGRLSTPGMREYDVDVADNTRTLRVEFKLKDMVIGRKTFY